LTQSTTELRAAKLQIVAQRIEQRSRRVDVQSMRAAIYL
jgi:hypothetical protein